MPQEQVLGPSVEHWEQGAKESGHCPEGMGRQSGIFKWESVWSGVCFGKLTLRAVWRMDLGVTVGGEDQGKDPS